MKFECPGALGGAPRVHLDWAWIWGHQGRPSGALGPLTEAQNSTKTLEKQGFPENLKKTRVLFFAHGYVENKAPMEVKLQIRKFWVPTKVDQGSFQNGHFGALV